MLMSTSANTFSFCFSYSDMAAPPTALLTRRATHCPLFGSPCELKENVLPTYQDVSRYYEFVRFSNKSSKKELTFGEISKAVAMKLEQIWSKASIPVLSRRRIIAMLLDWHQRYKNILKPHKSSKNNASYQQRMKEFKERSSIIFDIAACKCGLLANPYLCCCEKDRKVPAEERTFLLDQRSDRNMFMHSVDVTTSKILNKRAQ